MPYTPPWLNVKPSDFVAAAESGAALGQQARAHRSSVAAASAALAQRAQEANQRAAMEQQQLDAAAKESALKTQIAKEQSDFNNTLSQQKLDTHNAYLTQQVELQKNRLAQTKAQQDNSFKIQMARLAQGNISGMRPASQLVDMKQLDAAYKDLQGTGIQGADPDIAKQKIAEIVGRYRSPKSQQQQISSGITHVFKDGKLVPVATPEAAPAQSQGIPQIYMGEDIESPLANPPQ